MRTVAASDRGHRSTVLTWTIWLALSGCGRTTGDGADASNPPPGDAAGPDVSVDASNPPQEDAGRTDISEDGSGQPDTSSDSPTTIDADGPAVPDVTPVDACSTDAFHRDSCQPRVPCGMTDGGSSRDVAFDDASVDASADMETGDSPDLDVTGRGRECIPDSGDRLCCTQDQPVWDCQSTSFSYGHTANSLSPPPPSPGGCPNSRFPTNSERYDFFTSDGTLMVRRCIAFGSFIRVVHLTQARFDAIVAAVSAVRTTCVLECVPPDEYIELAVPASGLGQTYLSNGRAGCMTVNPMPPFAAYDGLRALGALLEQTVNAACGVDAGVDPDAGSCINPDAGISDASGGG